MTVSVLRPNATTTNTGALTGGATAHAVLSDDSDASYIEYDASEYSLLAFDDLTLPAGAVVKFVALRVRTRKVATTGQLLAEILGSDSSVTSITWLTPTTHTGLSGVTELGDAEIDAVGVTIYHYGGGDFRMYEVYLDVTYVTQPVTNVTLPSGTYTDDTTPPSAWTNTLDADGGGQTHIEYKLFTAAQYGAGGFDPDTSTAYRESGILAFTASGASFADPIAGGTYRIYLRVAQTVNGEQHFSDWDFEGFVMNTDVPANPTVVITPQAGDARHLIEVTAGGGGAVTTDIIEVQASYDGGTTYRYIRTPHTGTLGDGQITPGDDAWDWEAPNGVATTYRARAVHDWGGTYSYSAWVSDTDTWTSTSWWFKHPVIPTVNYEAAFGELHSFPGKSRAARQGVFQPLGATYPVVVDDTRGSETGQIVIRCDTDAQREELDTLLDLTVPVLVQPPSGEYETDRWVRFGDHDRQRVVDKSWIAPTLETLAFTTIDRPTDEVMTSLGLYPSETLFPAEDIFP